MEAQGRVKDQPGPCQGHWRDWADRETQSDWSECKGPLRNRQ